MGLSIARPAVACRAGSFAAMWPWWCSIANEGVAALLSRNPSQVGHAAGLISTWNPRLRLRLASLVAARVGLRRGERAGAGAWGGVAGGSRGGGWVGGGARPAQQACLGGAGP